MHQALATGRSAGGGAVELIFGTANQIDASSSTGDITLSLANPLLPPGRVRGIDGTAASPTYSFANSTATGLFRRGTDNPGISIAGTDVLNFQGTGSTGYIYGSAGGQSITFSSTGSFTFAASGTNQSITLTPSGTGATVVNSGGANTKLTIAESGTAVATIQSSSGLLLIDTLTASDIRFRPNGSQKVAINGTTGNLLLGGLTTDGTGVLQLPTGTTAAGGITFGNINLFQQASSQLTTDATTKIQCPSGFYTNIGGSVGLKAIIAVGGDVGIQNPSGQITLQASTSIVLQSGTVTALTLDSSQNATFAGAIIGAVQALSGAGAVNVTQLTTAFTSTGGAQALTLANGSAGQIKTIVHVVDGGSGVLTPTTKTGFSTITFTNAGDAVTLQYFTTQGWCIAGLFGAVAA